MVKGMAISMAITSLIAGTIWGWLGFALVVTLIVLGTIAYFAEKQGKITIPELHVGVVFEKKGEKFARFLEPGTHWINPVKEMVVDFIPTSGQTANAKIKGVQVIGGLPVEVEWTAVYTLEPLRLAQEIRPKMARALPKKSAGIAQQHINNCLHHIIGDCTIEQLCEPGIHRKLERLIRQEAITRLEGLGYNINRIMIDAIHMPKQVLAALETAHEREMQAQNEIRALERLQKVVSQFSEADMQRLLELERINKMGQHGVAMVFPTMGEQGMMGQKSKPRLPVAPIIIN